MDMMWGALITFITFIWYQRVTCGAVVGNFVILAVDQLEYSGMLNHGLPGIQEESMYDRNSLYGSYFCQILIIKSIFSVVASYGNPWELRYSIRCNFPIGWPTTVLSIFVYFLQYSDK